MKLYHATVKENVENLKKNGFMEKDMNFTTDLSYARQLAKPKANGVVVEIELHSNAFQKTKAKKPTYRNIVRFLTKVEEV
jgi:hypothetical protein